MIGSFLRAGLRAARSSGVSGSITGRVLGGAVLGGWEVARGRGGPAARAAWGLTSNYVGENFGMGSAGVWEGAGQAAKRAIYGLMFGSLATTNPGSLFALAGAAGGSAFGTTRAFGRNLPLSVPGVLLGGLAGYGLTASSGFVGAGIGAGVGMRQGGVVGAVAGAGFGYLAGRHAEEHPFYTVGAVGGYAAGSVLSGGNPLVGAGLGFLGGISAMGYARAQEHGAAVGMVGLAGLGLALGGAGTAYGVYRTAGRSGAALRTAGRTLARHPYGYAIGGAALVGATTSIWPQVQPETREYARSARGMSPNHLNSGGMGLAIHYAYNRSKT